METHPAFHLYFRTQTYNTNTLQVESPFSGTCQHLLLMYISLLSLSADMVSAIDLLSCVYKPKPEAPQGSIAI